MKSFLDQTEREALERLKLSPDSTIQRAAKLLLYADKEMPIRQIAAALELSRSGVFYWISRFRRLRMDAFLNESEVKNEEYTEKSAAENPTDAKQESSTALLTPPVDGNLIYPQPIQKPGLLPDDTFSEAGRKILLYHFSQMLSQEEATLLGKDIEALHDMRVATRRMRAAFDVFAEAYKPGKIKSLVKGLRITGRALGRVRDLDVFLDKAKFYLEGLPPEQQHGMDSLLSSWQAQRDEHRAVMANHLESSSYQAFKVALLEFLQPSTENEHQPQLNQKNKAEKRFGSEPKKIMPLIPLLVYSRLAAISTFESIIPVATLPQLHALRIEFKRLRYTLEFFVELLGSQALMVIEELKQVQDHLGDLHDADVACHNLSDIITGWENQHNQIPIINRPDPGAVINYLAYYSNERHRLLISFAQVWERFQRLEIRQNIALSLAGN